MSRESLEHRGSSPSPSLEEIISCVKEYTVGEPVTTDELLKAFEHHTAECIDRDKIESNFDATALTVLKERIIGSNPALEADAIAFLRDAALDCAIYCSDENFAKNYQDFANFLNDRAGEYRIVADPLLASNLSTPEEVRNLTIESPEDLLEIFRAYAYSGETAPVMSLVSLAQKANLESIHYAELIEVAKIGILTCGLPDNYRLLSRETLRELYVHQASFLSINELTPQHRLRPEVAHFVVLHHIRDSKPLDRDGADRIENAIWKVIPNRNIVAIRDLSAQVAVMLWSSDRASAKHYIELAGDLNALLRGATDSRAIHPGISQETQAKHFCKQLPEQDSVSADAFITGIKSCHKAGIAPDLAVVKAALLHTQFTPDQHTHIYAMLMMGAIVAKDQAHSYRFIAIADYFRGKEAA